MKKTKVSIQRALSYEGEKVRQALVKNIEFLGDLQRIIRPNSKVFVKINHLSPPSTPEDTIITHPAFTKELLRLLLEIGCQITVGDDIQSQKKDGFLISGYREICSDIGVRLSKTCTASSLMVFDAAIIGNMITAKFSVKCLWTYFPALPLI
jgi:uncharacterized protein (DUF362 family)